MSFGLKYFTGFKQLFHFFVFSNLNLKLLKFNIADTCTLHHAVNCAHIFVDKIQLNLFIEWVNCAHIFEDQIQLNLFIEGVNLTNNQQNKRKHFILQIIDTSHV